MESLDKWINDGGKRGNCPDIDWDFPNARGDKTSYLTHGLITYSSKYIPQIPHNLILKYTNKRDLILDPFVGSGTTLIESRILDRISIGIDINPYSTLISFVKTLTITPEIENEIRHNYLIILDYINSYRSQIKNIPDIYSYQELDLDTRLCDIVFINRLYSKANLNELLIIKSAIKKIDNYLIKNIFNFILLGILRKVSFLTSNFGNDYVPRNQEKKSDVLKEFTNYYKFTFNKIKEYSSKFNSDEIYSYTILGDSRKIPLRNETMDFIVTHPPYISAIPYAEYFKLELIWMGLNPTKLDNILIGGKRSSKDVVDRFNGGMKQSFDEMNRVLKTNKYACVVIGNPKVKGNIVKSNEEFKKIATDSSFIFVKEIERNKTDCSHAWMKKEYILIFKKE